jgi:hypothetical protein
VVLILSSSARCQRDLLDTLSVPLAAPHRDPPAALRIADRRLDLVRRGGVINPLSASATFNLVARALADTQPETAAVLQGVLWEPAGLGLLHAVR